MDSRMRAIVVEEFGDPDVLDLRDWPVPTPASSQVLIEVECAGVNFADVMSRRMGYLGVEPAFVPGMEVAGTVVAVGDQVEGFVPGDRVCAMTPAGGYAALTVADADTTFGVPAGIDWPVAAALPMVVPTAYALLHEIGRVRAGDRVLVNAAAGGVGMVLGQMAQAAGALPIGIVSSADKASVAKRYGFEEVHTSDDAADGKIERGTVDLALDSVGGAARTQAWAALAPFGKLVAYGNASAEPEDAALAADLRSRNQQFAGLSITSLAKSRPDLLRRIAQKAFALVAEGTVNVEISREVTLEGVAEAHRDLETRRTTGKLVVRLR
jgi:NADPH:quinone reductase